MISYKNKLYGSSARTSLPEAIKSASEEIIAKLTSWCKKQGIPKEEFSKFIEHHGSKGTKYKNYILAFGTWVRNYKKWNPNGGEDKNGMYTS